MKTTIALAGALCLLPLTQAGEIEPYGNMTETAAVVFRADVNAVRAQILAKVGGLEGVEVNAATHRPVFELSPVKLAAAGALGHIEQVVVWWMPPQPPPQKVSEGGRHLKALRSTIFITLACLDGQRGATVVCLTRNWEYHGLNHIPFTEIPFFWGDSTGFGSYPSDRAWLEALMPDTRHSMLTHVVWPSDPTALEALKAISSKE